MKKPGFSLIEIVVAITIMAIVMAGVVPAVFSYIKKSRMATTKTTLLAVSNAIQQFEADMNRYPNELVELVEEPADSKGRWSNYLKGKIADAWGKELQYRVTKGAKQPFELYSWGPDGEGSPDETHIDAWEL